MDKTVYIVDALGNGDFVSLQEAIDALPEENLPAAEIRIMPGTYRGRVIVNRNNVHILGVGGYPVIDWNGCALDRDGQGNDRGTFLSYTMLITGINVTVEHLVVRNSAGDGSVVGQAVALYAAGDRGIFRDVSLEAHQDTLLCGPTMEKVQKDALPRVIPSMVDSVAQCPYVFGRLYFEHCRIRGDVDFIFGSYRAWFEGCDLIMNETGGWYTAANTPAGCRWGFVFHDCHLSGDCKEGKAYLGRPWRHFARTLFLECEMDACVAPEGFVDWDSERVITSRCGEYRSRGPGAGMEKRHPSAARLTDEEAEAVTPRAVLGGWDGWMPWEEK